MTIQNVQMRLVLSSDAKPRLKWTSELHQRFVDAVEQLGGPEKATPKSLMRVMAIDGLTLYHLKSHLQKYRMGQSHQNKQEESGEKPSGDLTSCRTSFGEKERVNESMQISEALQMQMEVQRKLHEQIEVQRRLQIRIEAQGKYLQSVLRRAQDTLSKYGSCSIEAEHAKAQLSELVSMVDSGCPSSSFSVLTQSESSMLASPESSWRKEETQQHEDDQNSKHAKVFPRMEIHPVEDNIDLNCKFLYDFNSRPKMIDLNSKVEANFLL